MRAIKKAITSRRATGNGKMGKVVSSFLAVVLALSMTPTAAFATVEGGQSPLETEKISENEASDTADVTASTANSGEEQLVEASEINANDMAALSSPSVGEPATQSDQPSDEEQQSLIRSLSSEWITTDTVNDNNPSLLSLTLSNDDEFSIRMRVRASLSNENIIPVGNISLKIPKNIVADRTGAPTGRMTFAVPPAPDDRASFAYSDMGDYYCLTNTREIQQNATMSFEFSIVDLVPHTINGGGAPAYTTTPWTAALEVTDENGTTYEEKTGDDLVACFATSESVSSSYTRHEGTSSRWRDNFPSELKPENADDYVYMDFYSWGVPTGNQAHDVALSGTVSATGMATGAAQPIILGVKAPDGSVIKGNSTSTLDVKIVSSAWSRASYQTWYAHTYVAIPKASCPAGGRYNITLDNAHNLTPVDSQASSSRSSRASKEYYPMDYTSAGGHWGIGASGYNYYPLALNTLREGNSQLVRFSTNALGFGYQNTWEDVNGDGIKDEDEMNRKSYAVIADLGDLTLSSATINADISNPDIRMSSITVSTPQLYDWTEFETDGRGYGAQPSDGSQNIYAGEWGYKPTTSGTAKLSFYATETVDGIGTGSLIATMTFANGRLTSSSAPHNDVSISGNQIVFSDASKITHVFMRAETVRGGISASCSQTYEVLPTDNMRSVATRAFENDDAPQLNLHSQASLWAQTGNDPLPSGTPLVRSGAWDYLQGASLAVQPSVDQKVDNDTANRIAKISITASVTEQSNIRSATDLATAQETGYIAEDTSCVWRALLPPGTVIDLDSVSVRDKDSIESMKLVRNFRDSGWDMLVVRASLSPQFSYAQRLGRYGYGDIPTLKYDLYYTWEDKADYGDIAENIVAYESFSPSFGTIDGYKGEPDTPSAGNNATSGAVVSSIGTLLDNLSDEEMPGSFVYGRVAKPLNIDTYAVAGFTKSATSTGKSWSTGSDDKNLVKVVEGGSYTYRLRYANGAGADTGERVGNIVFYDALDSGAGSEWAGQLCRIDTRNMIHAGVAPVIYYSTQSLDMNVEASRNLSDTSKWSTNVPAGGMSAVKSIAVDASKATDGSNFTLDADASIAIDIVMRAPRAATIDLADPNSVFVGEDNTGGKRAANTGYISSSLADGSGTNTITPSSTIAGLTPFTLTGQLSVDDDKDRDGKRPSDVRVVLLANGEDTGKHIDITLPEQNVAGTGADDPVSFDFTELFDDLYAADENGDDIFYSVAVTLPDGTPVAGYDLRSDSQRSEGEQFIDAVLVHDPEQIVLTGEKVWAGETEGDGHARPSSVKLSAVDIYGKTVKTTTATSANGWSYEFPSLPAYNRIGVPATYIVEEQAYIPGYVPSVSGTTVTNTYHPYGDLVIRNDYRPEDEATTPQAAKEKKATYTIDILRSGEPVSGEWSYVRSDGESGTISNGGTIEIPFGQSVTIKDLPSDVSYRVMQELPGGWSKISVSGDTGTILAGRTSIATFTNKYASSARLYVRAKKTLDGRDLVYRQFAVIMYNVDTGKQYRAFNDREGNFALQGIEYTSADDGRDITFVIAEEQQSLAGYMMDGSIYRITATVHDNGDGTISFDNMRTVKIADENGDAVDTPEVVGDEGIVFANIYRSSGEVNLAAWKTLSSGTLSDDQFSFTLTDDATNEVIQTKGNKADGTIPFDPISYNQYNAGEKHSYTVREVVDENDADITYDRSAFTYTVEVVDNGHGKLEFNTGLVKTSEDGTSAESDEPVFRNVSKPGSLEISKRLEKESDDPSAEHKFRVTFAGEDLEDGDWTFTRSEAKRRLQDYTAAELAYIADNELSKKGEESEYWDQFQEYMQNDEKWYYTLSDGTEMSFRIVGINHDTKSWAPNGEKAGLTMQAVELLPNSYRMNNAQDNNGGWRDSTLRANMNNTSGEINQLFSGLLDYVATVDKMTKNRDDGTSTNEELQNIQPTTTADKLWIMSYAELVETCHYTFSGLEGEGTQYKYWNGKVINNRSDNSCLIKYKVNSAIAENWWTRSVAPSFTAAFLNVYASGGPRGTNTATNVYGVCPCFCFGESFEPPEYWIDVPVDNAEAQALGVAGKRLLPANISEAAKDIANNKDASKYYPMYKSFMDNDVHMKVNWGDGQQYDVRIVGFNHDDTSSGCGKAGITWQFVDLLNDEYKMNDTDTNVGGWQDSALRKNMNEGAIWEQVPESLKKNILSVDKSTINEPILYTLIPSTTTTDKLWIMSFTEIAGIYYPYWNNKLGDEGSQYEYWNSKIKGNDEDDEYVIKFPANKVGINTQGSDWWTRSIRPSYTAFIRVTPFGLNEASSPPNYTNGICPCFCMGEPDPEYWITRKDGSIIKPAEIKKAADSIAELAEDSPYYREFKDFMDNGGDWDADNNAPGKTFGQALEDGYGLMHIKWGDGREYTARIVGMNHDDASSGNGKAGITWQFTGLLYDKYKMNNASTNVGGWRDSTLRANMNSGAIWNQVPETLAANILAVDKFTKNRDDRTASNDDLKKVPVTATSDKLWIMSYSELVKTCPAWWDGLDGEGAQYGYWNSKVSTNSGANACLVKFDSTGASYWWERSVAPNSAAGFADVSISGDPDDSGSASGTYGVCPCFCMGEPPAPEYWIETENGKILPNEIQKAANDIAKNGESSPYYQIYHDMMVNAGDVTIADDGTITYGETFGQALESGYGLMHIKWGDGREYTARIVGMNHDELSDGSGTAGLTWQFTGLLYDSYAMHGQNKYVTDSPYNTNNGGWRDIILRKWMNPDELTEGTSILDGEIDDNRVWSNVPASLQSSIAAVDKMSKNRDDGTTTNAALKNIAATATSDKLWIMSYPELVETCYSSWNGLEGEGSQYGYWNGKVTNNFNNNDCLKKYRAKYGTTSSQPTSAGGWWDRSVYPTGATRFAYVNSFGDPSRYDYASRTNYVCPCFCLGSPNGSTGTANTLSTASATVLSLDDSSNAISATAANADNAAIDDAERDDDPAATDTNTVDNTADNTARNTSDASEENAFSIPLLDYFFGDDTPAADAAETSDNNGTGNGNNDSASAMRTASGALVGSLPIASSVANGREGTNVPLRSSLLSMPNAYSTETVGVDAIPEFAKAETRALYADTASGNVDELIAQAVADGTLPASGTSGDEVQWEIDENGVLTLTPTNGVSGTLKKTVSWYGVIGESRGMHLCFGWWEYRNLIKKIEIDDGKTIILPTDASNLFALHNQLVTLDMTNFNTGNVLSMSCMFESCSSLMTLNLDGFETNSVTNMRYMFYGCSSLANLNLSSFDTCDVTEMTCMFESCSSLTSLDVSNFDTRKVTSMPLMFGHCSSLASLKLSSNFNTCSATSISYMFNGCSSLTDLDLSSFDTNKVKSMNGMFFNCSSLASLKFSNNFDTSNVTGMNCMFCGCASLVSLNLSSFNTHNVKDMLNIISNCSRLSRITLSPSFVIPETNRPVFPTPNSQYADYPITGKWISKDAPGEKGPYTSAELLNALVAAGTDTLAFAGTWEWEREDLSYTIEFNQGTLPDTDALSNISGSMPSITADAGYPCTIPSKTGYYAFGYKITGWKDDTNNRTYTPGEVLNTGIPGAQKGNTITLTAVWEKDTNAAVMKDNVLEFSLHGGETAHFDNIPSGTTYKIEELTQTGWKLVGTDGDTEGTITPNVTSTANFTNTVDPENTTPMTVNITGTKTFDGVPAADWSFELLDESGVKIDEMTSGDDGMFTFTHELTDAEKNGNAGRYTIREVVDANNTAVSYDNHEAHVTVSLVDGYATATLDEGDILSFANATAPARIIIDEHLTGQEGDGDPDAEITYRIEGGPSPEDIVTITIKPSDDPQEIPVVPGYPVKIIPVDVPDGYTIDIPEDGITLDPIDPGEEKQIDVSVTYTITGTGYIKINKVLEGANLVGGDFGFSLYRASKAVDSRGAELPLVTNSVEGTVLYPISFEGAPSDGDRSLWWLTENGEPMLDVWKNRIDMDDTRYDVYITWQDNGDGTATPVIEYPDSEDAFTFTNLVRTGNVEIVKTVEGTTPVSENTPFEYTVTVTPPDNMPDGVDDNGDKTWSVLYPDGHREEVPDGGTIKIVPGEENKVVIENVPVGYTVEVTPIDTPDGFDNTPDNEGSVTIPDDGSDSRIELVSRYSSIGDAEIAVQKQARGFDLADVSFTFSARNTETGEIVEGTSNGTGNVLFDLGEVTAADHGRKVVFDVCEVASGSTSYDWDDLHASVTVSFVDDGKGHMAARIDDWHYIDDAGAGDGLVLDADHAQFQEESASPVFVNTFLLSLPFTGGAGLPIALIVLGVLLASVGSIVIIRNKKRNAMKKDYQHRCERKNEKRGAGIEPRGYI